MPDNKGLDCHLLKIRIVSTCFVNHTLLVLKKARYFPAKFAVCMLHQMEQNMLPIVVLALTTASTSGYLMIWVLAHSGIFTAWIALLHLKCAEIYHCGNSLVDKFCLLHISLSLTSQNPHSKTCQDGF